MLVIDAANVVGSRPTGWWRDRGKAAKEFCAGLADALKAGQLNAPVVVVLEGAARQGVDEGDQDGLRVVHASGHGDDAIAETVAQAVTDGESVTLVTADRELQRRARQAGAEIAGPKWLLDRI